MIQFRLKWEGDTHARLNRELEEASGKVAQTQNYYINVKLLQLACSEKKMKLMTTMLEDTYRNEVRLYGEHPEEEWLREYNEAWKREDDEELEQMCIEGLTHTCNTLKRKLASMDGTEDNDNQPGPSEATGTDDSSEWETVSAPAGNPQEEVTYDNIPFVCEVCGIVYSGERLPFRLCWFCGETSAMHHGRCCPYRIPAPA